MIYIRGVPTAPPSGTALLYTTYTGTVLALKSILYRKNRLRGKGNGDGEVTYSTLQRRKKNEGFLEHGTVPWPLWPTAFKP